MSKDPNLERLYKRMSMDELDVLEAFEKAGWTLVSLNGNQFQWQSTAGGKSNPLQNIEEIVDFARDLLSTIQGGKSPVNKPIIAPPGEAEMPHSLAIAGWALHPDFGEWFCANEAAAMTTGMHASPEGAIGEAQVMQEAHEAACVATAKSRENEPETEEGAETLDASDNLPEMPQDLADVGWTFKREGDELYAVHEELMISTSHDQEDPEMVIAEARRMQEDYERQLNEQAKTPEIEIAKRTVPQIPDGEVLLEVDIIRLDGGTQMRVEQLDMLTVIDYAEKMKAGKRFRPVDVFFDGTDYWMADGFQRHAGTKRAELTEINAIVHHGTLRDAILFAVGANAEHGLPRTNADKRRAVEKLLYDDEWRSWTDSRVAEAAGVSAPYVKTIRDELTLKGLESPAVRVARDGRRIDTTRIGDRESAAQLAEAQPVLPGAEAAVAGTQPSETYVDDTRRAADFEMADPDGSLELESNALEEEEARRDFDPVNETNADDAARDELRARLSELVDAVRDKPNGMKVEELVELGITHEQIDQAARARIVERHVNGRIFYQWSREDIVAALRKHGPLNRFQLEDELGCQSWVINMAKGVVIRQTEDGAFTLIEPAEPPPAVQAEAAAKNAVEVAVPEPPATSAAAAVRAEIEENRKDVAAPEPPAQPKPPASQTSAPAEKPKQPSLRSILKGRDLFLSIVILGAVKDKVSLTINFEKDKFKAKRVSLHDYEIEGLPEPIRTAIERHLADTPITAPATSKSSSKKAAGKKGMSKQAPPAKASAGKKPVGAKKPVTRAPSKSAAKSGSKKSAKSTTKRSGARA